MAGRCACASAPLSGAAAAGSGCVSVAGAGTPASPFTISLLSSCLPLIPCTSGTRPPLPAVGQPIFETDTRVERVWDGTRWTPVSPSGILTYRQAGSVTPGIVGSNVITTLTIPDPGWPYYLSISANVYLQGGNEDDEWNCSISDGHSLSISGLIHMKRTGVGPVVGYAALPLGTSLRAGVTTIPLTYSPFTASAAAAAPANDGWNSVNALVIPR